MSENTPGEAATPEEPGGPPRRFRISRRGSSGQAPAPGSFRGRYARPGAVMKAVLATSWRQYTGNVVPLLIGAAIWLIPFCYIPVAALRVAPALGVSLWAQAGILLVIAVVLAPIQAGLAHAALRVEAGTRPGIADFFVVPNWGRAVATGVVVNIAVIIGLLLYVIPGLFVGVWCIFATAASVDRGVGPLKAFSASLELVGKDPVASMLMGFLTGALIAVSYFFLSWLFLAIFLPVVVGAQIVALAIVNLYRTLEKAPSPRRGPGGARR